MKWPAELTLVRHGESEFNALKVQRRTSHLYSEFRQNFEKAWDSAETRRLAGEVQRMFALGVGDCETPLTPKGMNQARDAAAGLAGLIDVPDVVFVSPYARTCSTFDAMKLGWPALSKSRVIFEDRIREQEHGLSLLYNDWRVFHVFHPDQHRLWELQGRYWYQFPQGESVSQVRDRTRSWMTTLVRECAGKRVMAITHHLTILSLRANLERLGPKRFIELDENETPINCGVTTYKGDANLGVDGRLVLVRYNQKLY